MTLDELLAVRREGPQPYAAVPADRRAQVLLEALRDEPELNDFGWIDARGHHDGEAAQALLELGDRVRPGLIELLADRRAAPLGGSETGTLSSMYDYRRCDWAYHYLSRLLGREAPFPRAAAERDRLIAELRSAIGG